MGRNKIKIGIKKLFYIDENNSKKLQYLAAINGLSNSSMIDRLIEQAYSMTDIGSKEAELEKERLEHLKIAEELRFQQEKLKTMRPLKEAFEKEMLELKERCITNLIRKIKEKTPFAELEELARNQSIMMKRKCEPEELLNEAYGKIKEPKPKNI